MNNEPMSEVVWVDGALHPASAPIITAGNHGLTVGDGVFETIAVRAGTPVALTRHLARLAYSLDRMALAPVAAGTVRAGVGAVLAAEPAGVTRVRVTVISGEGPPGLRRGGAHPTVIVMASAGAVPRECRAVRAPWRINERSPLAGVKTTSYAEQVVVARYAAGKGADEALMSNTLGHLCEGTGSNVFIERGGEVLTPPLASGCLPGIARGLAVEWGARAGLPVRVAALGELEGDVLDDVVAGRAFAAVTSSTRGVQPLAALDGTPLARGSLLEALAALYDERLAAEPDPEPPRHR